MLFVCQVRELEQASHTKRKDLEDSYRVKKRTIDLLPDAENNIAKLEVCCLFVAFSLTCFAFSMNQRGWVMCYPAGQYCCVFQQGFVESSEPHFPLGPLGPSVLFSELQD